MAIKISELANLTAYSDGTLMAVVDTTGPFATVKSTVGGLKTYVLGNIISTIGNLEANAAAQSGQITTANVAMKGYVDAINSTLTANAAVQAGSIAVLQANVITLTSNAAAQAGDIATLFANAGAQSASIATLTSNAAVQAGDIATLFANAGAQSGTLATLTANAGAQAGSIATLTSNAAAQAGDISTLYTIKANIASPSFTGTVTMGGVTVSANVLSGLTTPLSAAQGGTNINSPGANGNILTSNGTTWYSARPHIVYSTAIAVTSSASVDFTGIPPDANRITIMFSGVSTANINPVIVQVGDSGGIENTGYTGAVSGILGNVVSNAFSIGFTLDVNTALLAAAGTRNGMMVIQKLNANTWVSQSTIGYTGTAGVTVGGGTKATSAFLDRVRITTTIGTDLFDAGTINITYE